MYTNTNISNVIKGVIKKMNKNTTVAQTEEIIKNTIHKEVSETYDEMDSRQKKGLLTEIECNVNYEIKDIAKYFAYFALVFVVFNLLGKDLLVDNRFFSIFGIVVILMFVFIYKKDQKMKYLYFIGKAINSMKESII